MVNAIIMTVLIVAALAWFTLTMRTKILVLLKAKPQVRWDRVPERIEAMLKVAFAQSKMFKDWPSGVMHAFIFWGFLILLFRTISVFGRAFAFGPAEGPRPETWNGVLDSTWTVFWFCHWCENAYTYLKDWTELVVLAMIVIAALRRAILRPARLTLKPSAYLILSMIGGLMVTDFLFDGAVFASGRAANEMAFAPVSAFVSTWFPAKAGWLDAFAQAMFWAHAVILLVFLNELPLGKHFHVIVSIPNTFFGKLEPRGAVDPILDIENQESFGVNEPRELTWKQIFDGYACTECGRCLTNCPTYNTGKPLMPKFVICDTRDFIKVHEKDILAGKDTAAEDAVGADGTDGVWKLPADKAQRLIDAVGQEAIWECTTCRSCEENCPVSITHTDKIIDYRRRLVLMEGNVGDEVSLTLKNLENKSNPWGLPMGERGLWLKEELGVPLMSEKEGGAEYLWYLGCSGAYEDRSKKVAVAFAKLLQKAGVDFAILGPEEGCCGDTARRIGNEYLFQAQAQQNIEVFKTYNVKKIVTMCPHGLNTIKNEYPQFGGNFEVVHHTELLAQLLKDGKLTIPAGEEQLKVVFHDSCYLGRYNDIYDAPREILAALPGADVREPERAKKTGFCCGAGGGMMFREEHVGDRINRTRVKQLQETGADMVATACPFCLVMCRDGVNELELGDQLKTQDVAELLAKRIGV